MLAVDVNLKLSVNTSGNCFKRFGNNVSFKFKKLSTKI